MTGVSHRLMSLTPWLIKALIPSGNIGSYVLYKRSQMTNIHLPIYIGRSDTDLQRRLCNHPYLGKATHFQFDITNSPEKAFLMECSLYHALVNVLENKIHPAVPVDSKLKCPFCNFHLHKKVAFSLPHSKLTIRMISYQG
ncbi:hypothetical protein [Bacillus sp. FJAT-27445]|uniref:hypothetical protein n=1 Tax=Bacillus sp. FJAT-27445 TaxID=1679166 RepID=UPI0007435041|nr:hypothetical protein [Bacillus sp. FJAT-27445]